jgi:hypothetical protein
MAKYNLYRIVPEKRFEMLEKLRAAGLELAKKTESDGCTLEYFISRGISRGTHFAACADVIARPSVAFFPSPRAGPFANAFPPA